MKQKVDILTSKFVEFTPEHPELGVLYISVEYNTARHQCACGCGEIVVTPFSPHQWSMIYNGKTVSLRPSIGNWRFKCKSHYFVTDNKIQWAGQWNDDQIAAGRAYEKQNAKDFYTNQVNNESNNVTVSTKRERTLLEWFLNIFK